MGHSVAASFSNQTYTLIDYCYPFWLTYTLPERPPTSTMIIITNLEANYEYYAPIVLIHRKFRN